MRLWHKDMLNVLPRQQLISQWRECCCIAKSLATQGTPNHILVNEILNYPLDEFEAYSTLVRFAMTSRGYKVSSTSLDRYNQHLKEYREFIQEKEPPRKLHQTDIYRGWHNDRYLKQCYYNLEEKYDRGGIPKDEWDKVFYFCRDRLSSQMGTRYTTGDTADDWCE